MFQGILVASTTVSRKEGNLPTGNASVPSRCGSLRPFVYADVRCIDDVIAIEGPPPFVVNAISSAIVGDGALSDHMAVVAAVNITWKSTLPVNACAAKCTCRGNRCYTKKRRLQ